MFIKKFLEYIKLIHTINTTKEHAHPNFSPTAHHKSIGHLQHGPPPLGIATSAVCLETGRGNRKQGVLT